jgi:hypothetical protein
MPAFAHAHNHHAPLRGEHGGYGSSHLLRGLRLLQAAGSVLQGGGFDVECVLRQLQGAGCV